MDGFVVNRDSRNERGELKAVNAPFRVYGNLFWPEMAT